MQISQESESCSGSPAAPSGNAEASLLHRYDVHLLGVCPSTAPPNQQKLLGSEQAARVFLTQFRNESGIVTNSPGQRSLLPTLAG